MQLHAIRAAGFTATVDAFAQGGEPQSIHLILVADNDEVSVVWRNANRPQAPGSRSSFVPPQGASQG